MDVTEFLHRNWYIPKLPGRPHLFITGGVAASEEMFKQHGISYDHLIVAYDPNYCTVFFDLDALRKLGEMMLEQYTKDKRYVSKLKRYCDGKFKKIQQEAGAKKITALSTPQLVQCYKRLGTLWTEYWGTGHMIEGITLTTDSLIKEKLHQHLSSRGEEEKFTDYFEILTQQAFLSFMNKEYNDLLKIKQKMVAQKWSKKEAWPLLQKHQQHYFWICNSYQAQKMLSVDYFWEELQSLKLRKDKGKSLAAIKKEKKLLQQKSTLPQELKLLLELTDVLTEWQDIRKEQSLKMIHSIELVLHSLAEKMKSDVETLRWLAPAEMREDIKTWDTEIQKRKNGFAAFHTEKRYFLLYGEELKKVLWRLDKTEANITEISGITGAVGRVRGTVKVCLSLSHTNKIQPGDILVTSMTRPEFVPAMKKAAGVITDEGGITCHAAIVARELGIPCLIGTRKASTILKDGMVVDLNASHGIVRILKE